MALLTKCKFYYGVQIDQDNNILDFDEGSGEISITIPIGIYSPKEISNKIAALMTAAGTQTYSCVFNRTTRKLTIGAVGFFSILIGSGSHTGSTVYANLGYTGGVDLTGFNSYASDSAVGYEFRPQFYLLDYTPLEHNIKSVQASINETGSGNIEVIRYGTKRFMECSIEFITNQKFISDPIWTSNKTGVEDALQFLTFATQKSKIEFMPNENDVANYFTLILESTASDQQGVGFKLEEMLDYGAGYYKTGRLVFREVSV